MGIAVDASSPTGVNALTTGLLTTGSFTPPASSLICVIGVIGASGTSVIRSFNVSSSIGLTWTQLAFSSAADNGGSGIYIADSTNAAMTVSLTDNTNPTTAKGRSLDVLVLTGAGNVAAQTGAHSATTASAMSGALTVANNSFILGAGCYNPSGITLTALGNTTKLQQINDGTNGETYASWRSTAAQSAGSVTTGFSTATGSPTMLSLAEIVVSAVVANSYTYRRFNQHMRPSMFAPGRPA